MLTLPLQVVAESPFCSFAMYIGNIVARIRWNLSILPFDWGLKLVVLVLSMDKSSHTSVNILNWKCSPWSECICIGVPKRQIH
jgi:hypothetical protein